MRYKMTDIDNEYFYMLPQSLFNYPQYRPLSTTAKVIYAILKNRMNMSRRNNWHNAEGDIYLEFSSAKMAKILCVSRATVSREMKALVEFGLIDMVDRRAEGRASLIYIHKIQTPNKASDIIDVEQETYEEEREAERLSACEAVIRSNNAMSDGFSVRDDGSIVAGDGSLHGSIYPASVGECTYARGSNMMMIFNNPFMNNGHMNNPDLSKAQNSPRMNRGVFTSEQGGVHTSDLDTYRGVCIDEQGGVHTNETPKPQENQNMNRGVIISEQGGVQICTGVFTSEQGCSNLNTNNKDYKQRNRKIDKKENDDDDVSRARTRFIRKENDEEYTRIMQLFSENIHPLKGSIDSEHLEKLYHQYGSEWCSEAIREAVMRNGRSILYVEKILQSWEKNGYKSSNPSKRSPMNGTSWSDTGTSEGESQPISYMELAARQPKPWRNRPDLEEDIKNCVSYAEEARKRKLQQNGESDLIGAGIYGQVPADQEDLRE